MKIAQIVPSLRQAGPVNVAHHLTCLLTAAGHDVTVFYFDDFPSGTHTFPCPMEKIAMSEPMDFNQFDVVHTHGQRPAQYVQRHRKPGHTVRFITTAHNYVFQDYQLKYGLLKGTLGGLLYLRAARAHDCVICLSDHALQYYGRFLPKRKLTYIYNTVQKPDAGMAEEQILQQIANFRGEDGLIIGTNCSLIRRKGLDLLIGALPMLPERVRLVLLGDGKERAGLEAQAHRLGVAHRVLFLGFQPNAAAYLPHYDIYALCSRSEGFPLGLLEALSVGLPVVCAPLPTLKEAFRPGEVQFIEEQTPKATAQAIETALRTPELAKNGRSAYEQRLSPALFLRRHLEAYGV